MLRARTQAPLLRPGGLTAVLLWTALIACGLWTGAAVTAVLQMLVAFF